MGAGGSTLKIVGPKGKVTEYYMEMTVQEIEDEFPGFCVSEGTKQFKTSKSELPGDRLLRMGKVYFLKSRASRLRSRNSLSGEPPFDGDSSSKAAFVRSLSADSDLMSASAQSCESGSECSLSPRSGPMEPT